MRFCPECKRTDREFAGNPRKTVAEKGKVCYTNSKDCKPGPFAGRRRRFGKSLKERGERYAAHESSPALHRVFHFHFRAESLFPKFRGTAVLLTAMPLFLGAKSVGGRKTS